MSTQWHPLFAHLLRLLLEHYYEVQTEVPVSDLPRRSDLLLLRRQTAATPPFQGLWSHLTDWNVVEFKGPGDDAHEDDLELLVHVGTGLTVRFNEERVANKQPRLDNRQVSFWYVAPVLGETFLGHARTRMAVNYETGGLWRGSVWGHPIWLVSARDVPVEADTIPLHLLDREPGAPRAMGELVVQHEDLLRRFATWVFALQPRLWEEIRYMVTTATTGPHLDWETIGKYVNLDEVVRTLPPDRVLQILGADLSRVIEAVGLPRLIEVSGAEKVLDGLLARIPPEQLQEMIRQRQQRSSTEAAD